VSYSRFVELQRRALLPAVIFLQVCCPGKCTGISIIDSAPVRVCHVKREKSHKVFKGLAAEGKSTVGRFFEFKLHPTVNDKGEITEFLITQAGIDDRQPLKDRTFHEKLFGKLPGDRGHISKDLFEKPFVSNIHPITKIKKNMKNTPMHLQDKTILRKRAVIETMNDQLKNICQTEHTGHRSFHNFIFNIISGLIAYIFEPKKPSLNLEIVDMDKIKKIA
jgi:hypothetical protein